LVACTAAGLLRAAAAAPAADASSIRPGGTAPVDRSGRRRRRGTGTSGVWDRQETRAHDTALPDRAERRAVGPPTQHSRTERNAGRKDEP
jgi:hypothetical protein